MDPNATLQLIIDKAARILEDHGDDSTGHPYYDVNQDDAVELAEAVQNLHTWLIRGGFLPNVWALNIEEKEEG